MDYKEFDQEPIVDPDDVIIRGFRFRKRELALGITIVVCLLVIIILAALLAAEKGSGSTINSNTPFASGQVGNCNNNTSPTTFTTTTTTSAAATTTTTPTTTTTTTTTIATTTTTQPPPVGNCSGQCFSPACLHAAAYATSLLNASASQPCRDFYNFACSNFPRLHPLDPDEPELTTLDVIHTQNMDKLRIILEKTDHAHSSDPTYYETKARYFFDSCRDHFQKMKRQGRPFLEQVLNKADGWWALGEASEDDTDNEVGRWAGPDNYNFQDQLEKVHVDFWTAALYTYSLTTDLLDWRKHVFQITFAGLGINWAGYYVYSFTKIQTDYQTFMHTVASLLMRDAGLDITDAERDRRATVFTSDVFYFETQLAQILWRSDPTEDPHHPSKRLKLSDLNAMVNGTIDWVSLFTRAFADGGVTGDTYVVVDEQEYFVGLTQFLSNMDSANKSRILNNYLVWKLAHRYVQEMSWDYIHANREFYNDVTGRQDFLGTWRYCLHMLDTYMSDALGALFVRDHFGDANKKKAHEITDYVQKALLHNLDTGADWMSDQTRRIAIQKINDSLIKLGYPDFMVNETALNTLYSSLNLTREDYFGNLLAFNGFTINLWNNYMANWNDESMWFYNVYDTLASYYNPWKELTVTAGMLQFPVFDHHSPGYMNFGSLGTVVGKVLTRGIDEYGRQFMVNGSNWGDWWSNSTATQYNTVRQCVMDSFDNVTMGPFRVPAQGPQPVSLPVNADQVAPHILAEASGVQLAYKAYQEWSSRTGGEKAMPGGMYSNDQMFFIAYAQTYCANKEPVNQFYLLRRSGGITEQLMVNHALSHVKEFQDAWQCSAQSNMVADERCGLY